VPHLLVVPQELEPITTERPLTSSGISPLPNTRSTDTLGIQSAPWLKLTLNRPSRGCSPRFRAAAIARVGRSRPPTITLVSARRCTPDSAGGKDRSPRVKSGGPADWTPALRASPGLPIDGAPWVLDTPSKRFAFCCDGCLGIFQMLHDIDAAPSLAPAPSRR